MGLILKEDKYGLPNVTVKNIYIKIDCIMAINPATPYIERGPDKIVTHKVPVTKTREDGESYTETEDQDETLPGDIIKTEKRYSANIRLQYFSDGAEGSYADKIITINGLKQDEWTYSDLYKKIMEIPEFEGAKKD